MRVGYSIVKLASSSQKGEFSRFLKDTLILEEGYADNIANVLAEGGAVNLYTQRDLSDALGGDTPYAFSTTYNDIEVGANEYLVVSAVDFRLEISTPTGLKVLAPTEYFKTSEQTARSFKDEIEQGLLKVFPELPSLEGSEWILNNGFWEDEGVWMDGMEWQDD